MDYLQIANSPLMWIAAAIPVSVVLIQAALFVKKTLATAKEMGMESDKINSAVKASFITSIGPSIVVVVGMLSLLVVMGGPISWLRLAFIGSVQFELLAAKFGIVAAGASFEEMTNVAYANGVWTMVLGSLGWIVMSTFFTGKLDGLRTRMAGGNAALIPVISIAAMLGAFAYNVAGEVLKMNTQTIAAIAGLGIMVSLGAFANRSKAKWINEWALTIAMFGGMFIATLF